MGFHGAKRFVEHCQKRMLEDRGALPKEEGDIQGHARRKLSQQLVGDGCGRQRGRKGHSEPEKKSLKGSLRETRKGWLWFENGLAVDFPLVMNVRVLEKGLEEVVDVSGDESEHWCEVSVCVLVSVPHVLDLISPANLVCDVDLPSVFCL